MHIVSGDSGSVPAPVRASAWLLLGVALAGCASEKLRAPPPEEPAPTSSVQVAPPTPPEAEAPAADAAEGAPAEKVSEPGGEVAAGDVAAGEAPAGQAPASETPASEIQPSEVPESEAAPAPAPAGAPSVGQILSGSLGLRYRGRATDEDQDHELRGVLTLDLADPRAPWIRAHLLARADLDLDGLDEGPIFQDLSDTYDSSLVAKLYLAYAELDLGPNAADSPGTLVVGRQSDARLPEVLRLDGVSYVTRPLGRKAVELGLYGGVPVHLYEDSPDGDQAYGTWLEGQPWKGGRARVDWMHLEDELTLGAENNDLLALGLWQELSRNWRVEGEFSRLENDPRDMRLRALYQRPESETLARLSYYVLRETQTVRVTELDPFTESLLDYYPYGQVSLNVSQGVAEHVLVDAGIDLRRVDDPDDVGEFNRDWERYYATATVHDAPVEGLALSLTADRWYDEQNDTSTLGADVSFEQEAWRAALGTYYSLYKYDFLDLSEHDDVRTYYVRGSRDLSRRLRLELGYELEDDDLETYHTLRGGMLWRF